MENTKKVVNTDKNLTIATPATRTIVSIKNGSITESETTQEIDPNLTYIEKLQLKYKCCLLDWIIVFFCKKGKDHDIDDLEMQMVRYKPEGLDVLCRNTKFSRKELQIMYRGFKQSIAGRTMECPTGIVNEDTFKDIYAQFFPQGDSSNYAHYVFNAFDHDHSGSVNFEEFVMGLSVLSRGTLQERLQWAFNLYDINGDGIITKDEMMDIVSAIYEMMGRFTEPSVDENTAREHVDRVFSKMDLNKDGVISLEEFMDTCRTDENITKGMAIFDTVL